MVSVLPVDTGRLMGFVKDTTGESKVKMLRAVPMIALTETRFACVLRMLKPAGVRHFTCVPDDQDEVWQCVLSISRVGVASKLAKLIPIKVSVAPRDVALLGRSALVMTGASNVKEFEIVPTSAVTVTLRCFCFCAHVDQWIGARNLIAVADVHETEGAHTPAIVADALMSWWPNDSPVIVMEALPHVGPLSGSWYETTGASKVKI